MAVTYDDFKKLEIKIGKILSAEPVEKSEKLLRLQVDFGKSSEQQEEPERRQVVSGIAKFYTPDELVGKEFPFVTNLEPRSIMGIESQGMIMGIDNAEDNSIVLLTPEKEVQPGSTVR